MLGPLILAGVGLGMVIAPAINTGTFGVAPQDAGVAAATVTVGQMLGGSIGTSLLNTIFASAVASYLTAHLALARLIGRQALTGLALAHGYDTALVDRRHLRRRRRHRRYSAPPRATGPTAHTVPGRRPGGNGTDQGESHSSGVIRLRPTRKSPEPGDSRSP